MIHRSFFRVAALLLLLVIMPNHLPRSNGPESAAAEPPIAASTPPNETATPDRERGEFEQAGVCARCHVVSVLEWSVSAHVDEETSCLVCHGPSHGHVSNERNEVKPDRLARGEAIAEQLCSICHERGCPETLQVQNCQKCHHVHSLLNPEKPPAADDELLEKLRMRWRQFENRMANGEDHVKRQDWSAAQTEFREATRLIPDNPRAANRIEMCARRLNPRLPGFQIVGEKFDGETGLPHEVRVVELNGSMLLVSPGEFDIGSDALADSRPVHTVRLDAFYLGRYEVTQKQWKVIMGANPSVHQGEDFPDADRLPVDRVSWDDCQEFLRRLNSRVAGGGFRLPTETEWEFACRAGGQDSRSLPSSRESQATLPTAELAQRAWYRANSLRVAKPQGTDPFVNIDGYAPRPIGSRQPNAWGFYDTQGNVAEWCSSLLRPYLYSASDGRESLETTGMRVLRGGGFADSAAALDPALRHAERQQRRIRWNGLRLARCIPAAVRTDRHHDRENN